MDRHALRNKIMARLLREDNAMKVNMTEEDQFRACRDAGHDLAGDFPEEVWEEGAMELAKALRTMGEITTITNDQAANEIYSAARETQG